MRRTPIGVALLLAAHASLATAADGLAPFERTGLVPLPPDVCQELRIERAGEGVLEVRFYTEPLLRPTGPDPKTSGASLLLAAEDLERASLVVYDRSGVYARTMQLAAPIRWSRGASELCVASGSTTVACADVSGEILGTMRIAFGAGWQAEITGCAALAMRERSARAWIVAAMLFAAGVSLAIGISRRRRPAALLLALASAALFVVLALTYVPHPVWVERAAEPAVPPLWLDSAHWHPRAAHQSLEFRDNPLAAIEPSAETWLVLGGSVVFGDGVAAEQTFTAVAQDRLRAAGDPIVLLNAGAQGWNIHNLDRLMADLGDSLPLTGIVLVSILNNATLPIAAPHAAGCDRSLLRAWLCNVSRNQLVFTWPKAFLPKPSNPERFRSALRVLLERERRLGRAVVLLDEVAEFDRGGLRIWDTDSIRTVASEVAAEFGAALHPVDEAIAALAPEQRFLDGVHPTPAMHVLLGSRLAEILRER